MRSAAGCSETRGVAGGDVTAGEATGATASLETFSGSSCCVSSSLVGSASTAAGVASAASDAFESMLVLPVSAAAVTPGLRSAGLSGRDPRSDDVLEFSVPFVTAFANRSCNLEFGLLRDELRDRPPCSTANFLSTAALSPPSGLVVASAAAGLALPSSAKMVSSRDSRPEIALFHQFFPLILKASSAPSTQVKCRDRPTVGSFASVHRWLVLRLYLCIARMRQRPAWSVCTWYPEIACCGEFGGETGIVASPIARLGVSRSIVE